jgi:Brp/Blh family beta-carotene 15,15'-monooxygenase
MDASRPSVVAFSLLVAAGAVLLPLEPMLAFVPFALSVPVLGLPHGAVDELVPYWMGELDLYRSVGAVFALYFPLMAAYVLSWLAFPVPSLVFFLGLTVYHWGQGDLFHLLDRGASHLQSRFEKSLGLAVRGSVPVLAPMLFFPDRYAEAAGFVAGSAGLSSLPSLGYLYAGSAALGLTLFYAGYLVASKEWSADLGLDLSELGVLWLGFALVPPVLSVGLYYVVWHSLRHSERLLDIQGRSTSGRSLAVLHGQAVPMVLLSLPLLAVMYLVLPVSGFGLRELLGFFLVVISVLTLPHTALVTYMDLRQGVWS